MDTYPDSCKPAQIQLYQSEICGVLIEHVMALNVVTDTSGMWIHPGGHRNNVSPNVFTLTQRMVDKVWKNALNKSDTHILEFLIYLLTSAVKTLPFSTENLSRISTSPMPGMDVGFTSLNRLVIYQISRPTDTISSQMSVLDALHKLVKMFRGRFLSLSLSRLNSKSIPTPLQCMCAKPEIFDFFEKFGRSNLVSCKKGKMPERQEDLTGFGFCVLKQILCRSSSRLIFCRLFSFG